MLFEVDLADIISLFFMGWLDKCLFGKKMINIDDKRVYLIRFMDVEKDFKV